MLVPAPAVVIVCHSNLTSRCHSFPDSWVDLVSFSIDGGLSRKRYGNQMLFRTRSGDLITNGPLQEPTDRRSERSSSLFTLLTAGATGAVAECRLMTRLALKNERSKY
jgi:hypothetical protein